MSLAAGTRVGPYEIVSAIGAGGMGEVYRARDTKLQRDVAIKVLPDLFAADPERLARFEREAQLLASLNHPNIAHVYGVEDRALVMELVEGDDLAQRLARGPIPVDEALAIARQIADALEAAHEHGIVHRDLKPANVKVRPDGAVKVLDFGLAKAMEPPRSAAETLNSPTFTAQATQQGLVIGTAAYMPPEQARGKTVDKRADIWAFGCVLYEMLGGRQTFGGDTITDVLAAVVRQDPDWTTLPVDTPSSVRRLLVRCLQKDPARRLRDISDARLEIDDRDAPPSAPPPAQGPRPRGRERLAWTVAAVTGLAAIAAVAAAIALRPAPAADVPETRLEFNTPPTPDALGLAISPDGRDIVVAAFSGGQPRLVIRPLGVDATQTLNGTEGAAYPFWSPDGKSVGFFADGALKRVDRNGSVLNLARASASRGATWGGDDTIVFAAASAGPLSRMPAAGGTAQIASRLLDGQQSHRFPQFLSDGRHFVFYAQAAVSATRGVYLGELGSLDATYLVDSDVAAVVANGDSLLLVRQGTLSAHRLDVAAGKLVGNPVPIATDVAVDGALAVSAVSAGAGTIIMRRGSAIGLRDLVWYDQSGKPLAKIGESDPAYPRVPELSPDESKLAIYRSAGGNTDVWLIDTARAGRTRFTFDASSDVFPVWSPDGSQIVFGSNRKGMFDLYQKASSGSGVEQLILESSQSKVPSQWSPDSRFLVYRVTTDKGYDLWALPMSGDRTPVPLATSPFEEREGQVSPDSRWLAYQSNESGRFEIWVQGFPVASSKWQVSQNGGAQVRWSADGKRLFYMALDGRLHVVDLSVTPDRAITVGADVALFTPRTAGGPLPGSDKHTYAVSRDGRLLVVVRPEGDQPLPLSVVLNWKMPR
jgi:eukaryotic-like serine/threonine-protein kinase